MLRKPVGRDRWTSAGRGVAVCAAALTVLASACTGGSDDGTPAARASSSVASSARIPQPDVPGLRLADEAKRVDLDVPTFSKPTTVTNPLFPVSKQESVLLLGRVDGEAFRTEVTLLHDTRVIDWAGQRVETLVSQYVAFLDDRIHEVAYDYYAQDDDGAVWYFGEDVFNFEDGAIVDTHGSWLAGKDGPAAMIMPAQPKVGDVYRPENIPGFVFEEVTVKAVDQKLDGPLGAISGGLLISELHMDGASERKSFAPGYGEFFTSGGGDTEALALAVPTDAATGGVPPALAALQSGAMQLFTASGAKNWTAAARAATALTSGWTTYRAGGVPRLVAPRMAAAVAAAAEAVAARDVAEARQAALDVARSALDIQLRHRRPVEVDLARFDLWAAQLVVDAAARDEAAVNGDFFAMDYVRDRVMHAVSGADAQAVNSTLEELLGAIGDGDLAAVAAEATRLRTVLAAVRPV